MNWSRKILIDTALANCARRKARKAARRRKTSGASLLATLGMFSAVLTMWALLWSLLPVAGLGLMFTTFFMALAIIQLD